MAARNGRRQGKRKPERWNDPAPRRGNPLGVLLILIGLAGAGWALMGQYGCAHRPRTEVPVAQQPSEPAPEKAVPRARYEPKQVAVAEIPPSRPAAKSAEPEAPAARDRAAREARPAEVVEPSVHLEAAPSDTEFARNPAATGLVALSFDSYYDDKPVAAILRALDHHGFKATMFIAGRFAERYPDSVRRIADDGMELGNHSWSHPSFTRLSDAEMVRQLSRTNAIIEKLTGKRPVLFRPPYGDRNERVRRVAAQQGFTTVVWAVDCWDSVKKGITAEEITQRVLSRVQPGDVVLMHLGSQATADALEPILQGLEARGLRVAPVSELMRS